MSFKEVQIRAFSRINLWGNSLQCKNTLLRGSPENIDVFTILLWKDNLRLHKGLRDTQTLLRSLCQTRTEIDHGKFTNKRQLIVLVLPTTTFMIRSDVHLGCSTFWLQCLVWRESLVQTILIVKYNQLYWFLEVNELYVSDIVPMKINRKTLNSNRYIINFFFVVRFVSLYRVIVL